MLQTDSQYGVQANTIESTLRRLRGEPLDPKSYDAFRRQYALLPCKSDQHREFVLLCCALLPIPIYIGGQQQHWDAADVLAHWNSDFYFMLDDVKTAFEKLELPLPERVKPTKAADEKSTALFSITEDNSIIHFSFYGRKVSCKKQKGIRYIVHLIKNQSRQLSIQELYYSCNPPAPSSESAAAINDDAVSICSDSAPAAQAIDSKALKSIKQKIAELSDGIEIAHETGDIETINFLENEQAELIAYIQSNTTHTGQIAKTSSNNERMSRSISQAIRHSISDQIAPADKRLAQHLTNCIRKDHGIIYQPEQHYNWKIN